MFLNEYLGYKSQLMKHVMKAVLPGSLMALVMFSPMSVLAEDSVEDLSDEVFEIVDVSASKRGKSTQLDEVVVTGSRTEQEAWQSATTVEVIRRKEIEDSGARTVAELMAQHSGIELEHTVGGVGIRMQGFDPQYTLILINGRRTIGRISGVVNLERYNVADIERIEIVKGAGSALYGSDAMGGVVNIVLKKNTRPLQADLTAAYGQRNAIDMDGRVGLKGDVWDFTLSGGYTGNDGFDLDTAQASTTGAKHDDYHVSADGSVKVTNATRLQASANYMFRDQTRVDQGVSRAVFDRRNRFEEIGASLETHTDLAATTKLKIGASHTAFRNQFFYDQRLSDALDVYEDSWENLSAIDAQFNHYFESMHLLTVGLEAARHAYTSPRLTDNGGERLRVAAFAQDEWEVTEKLPLTLVPGARVEVDSQFGTNFTPRLAARFEPWKTAVIRASIGRGYRAPSFQELYLSFDNPAVGYRIEGNTDLQPELSTSVQFGAEWKALSWATLNANLFYNKIDDLISTTKLLSTSPNEPVRYVYDNIAEARTMGVETQLQFQITRTFLVDAGYTFTDSLDIQQSRPLAERSRHRATLGLRLHELPGNLEFSTRGALVGPRPFFTDDVTQEGAFTTEYAPVYVDLEARIGWRINDVFTAFTRGTNLLDVGDTRFLPIPPRTIMLGFNASY